LIHADEKYRRCLRRFICLVYDRRSSFVMYKFFNYYCSMEPCSVLLIANSIFSSIKERDYSSYAYKASSSFSIQREWVKARTKINWHCILLLCPVLSVFFRRQHHRLVRCWIDHSDYHHIIFYVLVSLYLKRARQRNSWMMMILIVSFLTDVFIKINLCL
jgi:hypothetical protein